jgi:hypothetical protein
MEGIYRLKAIREMATDGGQLAEDGNRQAKKAFTQRREDFLKKSFAYLRIFTCAFFGLAIRLS